MLWGFSVFGVLVFDLGLFLSFKGPFCNFLLTGFNPLPSTKRRESREGLIHECPPGGVGTVRLKTGCADNRFPLEQPQDFRRPIGAFMYENFLRVVCDDGSVWSHISSSDAWAETIPPIPGSRREMERGISDLVSPGVGWRSKEPPLHSPLFVYGPGAQAFHEVDRYLYEGVYRQGTGVSQCPRQSQPGIGVGDGAICNCPLLSVDHSPQKAISDVDTSALTIEGLVFKRGKGLETIEQLRLPA